MGSKCDHKCNHSENRRKVCAPCGRKIILSGRTLAYFRITPYREKQIQSHINVNFRLSDPRFPTSICVNCRRILDENLHPESPENSSRTFKIMPNYEDIILLKNTRYGGESSVVSCQCYICQTARFKGHKKRKICVPIISGSKITSENGMYAQKSPEATETKVISAPVRKSGSTFQICNICFQRTGRGIRHMCCSKSKPARKLKRANIEKFVETLPATQQEQVCTSLVSKKMQATDKKTMVEMSTGGPKVRIHLNKQGINTQFSSDNLFDFQVQSGTSGRQMKKLCTFVRKNIGRKSVPSNYLAEASKKSKALDDVYKSTILSFQVDKNVNKQERPVVWADAEEILECVLVRRNLIGNYVIKVMADGGQGFFKICMTILPEDYLCTDSDDGSKRQKLDSNNNGGKLTGIHKLIMLGIVPLISETYDNVKILFDLIRINSIPFKFLSDFKLLLLVNGQQTATSSFPCPYCFVCLQDLRSRKDLDIEKLNKERELDLSGVSYSLEQDVCGLKTYGDLESDYQKFISLGSIKKQASRCNSTINKPLFTEESSVSVLEKCVVPELHLLQGFVNHLFWDGLVPLLGRDKAILWPQGLKLISKNYHGEVFEGNACRKLLKEPEKLFDKEISGAVGGELIMVPWVSAFQAMNKIVEACFGIRRNEENLLTYIDELRKAVLATGISETLKIHVAIHHIEESLSFLRAGHGFGLWSEQAGESVHHEFLKFWNRWKINNILDRNYSQRLRSAVVEFSSKHI